jgi:hypothetical protein
MDGLVLGSGPLDGNTSTIRNNHPINVSGYEQAIADGKESFACVPKVS